MPHRKVCPARQPPSRAQTGGGMSAGAEWPSWSSLLHWTLAGVRACALTPMPGVGVYREFIDFLTIYSVSSSHHLSTSPAGTAPLHWFSGVGSGAWADFARAFDVSFGTIKKISIVRLGLSKLCARSVQGTGNISAAQNLFTMRRWLGMLVRSAQIPSCTLPCSMVVLVI